jgi:hypothetical protein
MQGLTSFSSISHGIQRFSQRLLCFEAGLVPTRYMYKIGQVVFFISEIEVFTTFRGQREITINSIFRIFEETKIICPYGDIDYTV